MYYASAWKSGNGFPLIIHGYHSCNLGSSAMLSVQLYTPCFQTLWSSGSENYNEKLLYSQNPSATFKMRFWVHSKLVKGCQFWTQSDTLMKRGWKYPLKHQEGGEVPNWKIPNWEPRKDWDSACSTPQVWVESCPTSASFLALPVTLK